MTGYYGDKFYKLEMCEKLSIPLDMGEPELEIMQEWKSLYIGNLQEITSIIFNT